VEIEGIDRKTDSLRNENAKAITNFITKSLQINVNGVLN
jgi:hypothetical protein